MSDTAAPAAPPPASDPGELGPSAAPAPAPRPSASPATPAPARPSFEQQRHAQEQARAQTKPPAAPQEAAPAPTDQPAPPAAEKIKVGKYEVSEDELGSIMERQALDDLRKATVPAAPEAYEAKLPADFKAPGGLEFKLDEAGNKAAFDAARAWAHNKGFSQSDFSEMLGLYASQEAQQHAALAERSRQEIAKVGINGPQRVDAVSRWITGMIGEADAAPVKATIVTDSHLRFYETIMNKLSSQGGASFSQSHRAAPETNAIPNYDKMSFEQRRQAQDQNAARRGGR